MYSCVSNFTRKKFYFKILPLCYITFQHLSFHHTLSQSNWKVSYSCHLLILISHFLLKPLTKCFPLYYAEIAIIKFTSSLYASQQNSTQRTQCYFLFIYFFLLLFKCSCLHFHPFLHHPSLPPTLKPTPFGFVHGSFIHAPWWPLPYFPLLCLSLLLSGYCQFVFLFQCLWLYFACLFGLLIRFHL